MLPSGFVDGSKKRNQYIAAGPFVEKVSQCAEYCCKEKACYEICLNCIHEKSPAHIDIYPVYAGEGFSIYTVFIFLPENLKVLWMSSSE